MSEELDDAKDFMTTARARFKTDAEDERHIREQARIDLKFVAGDQWDERVRSARQHAERPCLTFSRIHTFVQQVANEARQNKMQVQFVPAEDGDKDTAEVYEGLARQIQSEPEAQIAIETAVEYSAGGSFGYFRYTTDYCNDENDDLDLKVVPVLDPFAVYGVLIPACFGQKPKHAFVIASYTQEEYKSAFPNTKLANLTSWDEIGRECGEWASEDKIRVAEYWYAEETKVKLSTGSGRTVTKTKVKSCMMNGMEVIEDTETEWPGSTIPIYAVIGKQQIIDGKPILSSLIRHQRDPQTLINVQKTRIAEILSITPISPWKAPIGSIPKEHRSAWEQAHNGKIAVLEFNTRGVDGQEIPAPVRDVFEPPIAALSAAVAQEIDDMKATAGIYDASLGARSNTVSGIAKQHDQQQANITNMHFLDNLDRACKVAGADMAELFPKVYDTKRMVRILGADETAKIVKINEIWKNEKGKEVHYKVGGDGVGKYDVVVSMTKAFSTKRMESFDFYMQLGQTNPEVALVTSDLALKNSDTAGAEQAAERMKRFIGMKYPGIIDDENVEPIPPQAQQMIAQGKMQLQALDAHAQELTAKVQQLEMEKQAKVIDNEYRISLEKLKIEGDITKAEIMTKAQNEQVRMKLEADMWAQTHDIAHGVGTQAADQEHELNMAQATQQAAEQQQLGQQAHEAGMAASAGAAE